MQHIDDPRLTSALSEGRTAYVAVDARNGPHVTPELYAWTEGHLAFAAASDTVKSKVLGRRASAAAVVMTGSATVLLAGEVVRPDPITAARWMAGFAVRNAPDLLGFATDVVRGRAGSLLPKPRAVFGLVPDRAALLEGDRVCGAWGGWSAADLDGIEPVAPPLEGVPAVLGWDLDGAGPVAVPVRWDAESCSGWLSPDVVAIVGLTGSASAAVVFDDYGKPGPAGKTGVMLRGVAEVDGCSVRFDADRVTSWDGVETSTESA